MAHHHHGRTMKSIFILLSALCAIVERGASFQTAPFHFSTPSRARNKLPYHHDKQSSLFPPPSHRKLMQQTAEAYPLSARSCECELQPIQSDSKKCHKEKITRERFTFESMDYLFQNLSRRLRTMILSLALATILVTSVAPLALATSYGRAGGSFGGSSARSSSSRSSIRSRSSSSRIGGRTSGSSHHHHYHQPSRPYYSPSSPSPLIHIYRAAPPRPPPIVVVEQPTDVPVLVPASRQSPARTRVSVVNDVVLLTATSRLMVYGFRNNFRRRRDREDDDDDDRAVSPLGPGATFTSVTVSIDVPDRDDPNCILQRLRRVAERTDTSTRKNVQNLVSEGRSRTRMLAVSSDPDCITALSSADPCLSRQYLSNFCDKATALYPQPPRRSITRKWRRRSANFSDNRSMIEANTIERQVGTKQMRNSPATAFSWTIVVLTTCSCQ